MPDEPSKPPAFTGDFRLGDWLVQPGLDRLSRGDTLVHLRPQLCDLLLLLARHAGKPVSKELILKEVWASQYVGESVLSRCITEIRQALHDDARAPKVIETIPKRGYRLVAPVVFLTEVQGSSGNGKGQEASEPAVPRVGEIEPALADDTPADMPPDKATSAESHAGTLSRARAFFGRLPWTPVKVAVVMSVAVTVAAGDWRPPAATSPHHTVLLADVTNATGNRVFDDALRLALAVNLEQAPFLRVLPQAGVRAALVRMGRSPDERVVGALAVDVCRREGAAVMLAGSIAPLGSRYAVGLEALACATGESLGRAIAEARDREHVLGVLEDVATRIRVKLGESGASLRQYSIPLVRATTASLEALEALTLGDDNRDHARLSEALGFYRQATELDPAFALAWARRGAAAQTLDLPEESVSAFRRAYELRDKVSQPERFYIEAHYYRSVAADPRKAIETYQAWKRSYPGSVVPPTNIASILAGFMGQYEPAIAEAREAVRLGPYSSIAYTNLIVAYLGSGRLAEARQAIADAAGRGISDSLMHRHQMRLALLDGDRAALDRETRWASSDPVLALGSLELRASAAMAAGRLGEARRMWADALVRAGEIGPARLVAQVRLWWAEAEALVGDARRARTAAQAGLAEDRSATTMLAAAIVYMLVGDSARARSLLVAVSAQAALDPAATLVGVPVARALLESKEGQDSRATAILESVVPFESGSQFGPGPLTVHGLVDLSGHRPAEAIASFEKAIRMRPLHPGSAWVPFARLTLARALRESGDSARSLAAYDEFLQSWNGADPDALLLAIARRERAALLAK